MKNRFFLFGMVILILSFVLVGCGDDDDNNNNNNNNNTTNYVDIPNEIRGVWKWECNICTNHTNTLTITQKSLVYNQPQYTDNESDIINAKSITYNFIISTVNSMSLFSGTRLSYALSYYDENNNIKTVIIWTVSTNEGSLSSEYFIQYNDCTDINHGQTYILQN